MLNLPAARNRILQEASHSIHPSVFLFCFVFIRSHQLSHHHKFIHPPMRPASQLASHLSILSSKADRKNGIFSRNQLCIPPFPPILLPFTVYLCQIAKIGFSLEVTPIIISPPPPSSPRCSPSLCPINRYPATKLHLFAGNSLSN